VQAPIAVRDVVLHDPAVRLFTDSNLDSYTCDGAKGFGTSVCGELFKITILDNDEPGVQVGAVPPEDTAGGFKLRTITRPTLSLLLNFSS